MNTKDKRLKVCNKLKLAYYNHKQIFNRDFLIKDIPDVTLASIIIKDIDPKSLTIGIAEAGDESIRDALNIFFSPLEEKPKITWDEYLLLNLSTKDNRLKVCNKLNIHYYKHKQLFNIIKIKRIR